MNKLFLFENEPPRGKTAKYLGLNSAPPAEFLRNTVLKNSSLQKNEEDREDKMSSALKQCYRVPRPEIRPACNNSKEHSH